MEDILNLSYREDMLIASLGGELDHHSAVCVRSKIDEALFYYKPRTLVIDIGHVDFMDSSGLGLIMGRLAKAKEIGTSLVIQNPSQRALRMLKMAGLDRMIPITNA
ncbi:MAG: anti-sigma factor antagonist [Clostridia bacterium]|nr:anti-sigma factor antagonist [Clostridia bacterium]